MSRASALTLLLLCLAPLACGEPVASFQARASCKVAYFVDALEPCAAEQQGEVTEAFCERSDFLQADVCGIRWNLTFSFRGPEGVEKRMWLWQSWEGGISAAVYCTTYSTDAVLSCQREGVGTLARVDPGACAVMLLETLGDMPPAPYPEYVNSPVAHAEAVTRIELCRDADGTPRTRVLE